MSFCDMRCKYATWPKDGADGSGSCRTFQAVYCLLKEELVHKNQACRERREPKEEKKRTPS
jgi:hypothetical protein